MAQGSRSVACSVDDCDKEAAKRGWCPMHYQRWRQHGDLNYSRPPKSPPVECSIDDCSEPHEARGWCNMHYLRWKRHGDPSAVNVLSGEEHGSWAGDAASYSTLHQRVYRARGRAEYCTYAGCDTGSTVFDWANMTGNYADIWDYEPMCRAHHIRYDDARRIRETGFNSRTVKPAA